MIKVMIVDDSRVFRKMLKAAFVETGHEVIGEAANGKEALELLQSCTPDLITLDITMPIMGGLEALCKIKELYPEQKVVVVSAAGQKAKVIDALKYGAADFIQKPFEPDDITAVLNKLFGSSES